MLIGLTGRAQAGKDTAYKVMADRYLVVRNVQRRAFADLLYRSAAAALGVAVEDLHDWKTDPTVTIEVRNLDSEPLVRRTTRNLLQRYGTEAHRDIFGADFWVDALDLTHGPDDLVVVTDVRFPNEAQAITKAGGHVVRVEGPYTGDDDHASEQPIPDNLVDYVLDNTRRDDGMARLRRNVGQLVLDIAARERWA